ncbi:MAG: hypothetical protein M1827_001664 [Pycnora praestabilis]|nr:MAG: hypothetical protein M1827_001664 [Pycnora praestabilis]
MSESEELTQSLPSNASLTKALQQAVRDVFKSDQLGELTVKRMRKATERALKLSNDFFKDDKQWNLKSKQIIETEAEHQHAVKDATEESRSSALPENRLARAKAQPKSKAKITGKGIKRTSPQTKNKPRKRQKKEASPDIEVEDSRNEDSEEVEPSQNSNEKATTRKRQATSSTASQPDSEGEVADPVAKINEEDTLGDDEIDDEKREPAEADVAKAGANDEIDASDSGMSVVIDEERAPKKKREKSISAPISRTASKSKVSKPKDESNVDPQEAEIKRLQSWLIKCGIRKMWYKELAPYDSSKTKISHLKGMLKDAGMDGRYSAEKAKQIKDDRELKAELEAVQQGARQWGEEASEDNAEVGTRPRRRLAKGLRELDFLGDDDGEETD